MRTSTWLPPAPDSRPPARWWRFTIVSEARVFAGARSALRGAAIALGKNSSASVSANGYGPLLWSQPHGGYYYNSSHTILDAGAVNDVAVSVPGLSPFEVQVSIPGDFQIAAPAGTLAPGQILDLSWSPSAGATGYNVLVEVSDGGTESTLNEVSTANDSLSIVMPTQPGTMDVAVVALGEQSDRHFSGAVWETNWRSLISQSGGLDYPRHRLAA